MRKEIGHWIRAFICAIIIDFPPFDKIRKVINYMITNHTIMGFGFWELLIRISLLSLIIYFFFKKLSVTKEKIAGIENYIKNKISPEKMILPVIGDIFDDDVEYVMDNAQSGQIIMMKRDQSGTLLTNAFYENEDNNQRSNLVTAIGKIYKTIDDGYCLRRGMVKFLRAYIQVFPSGKHIADVKTYLKSKALS